jgi:hypothetical protein
MHLSKGQSISIFYKEGLLVFVGAGRRETRELSHEDMPIYQVFNNNFLSLCQDVQVTYFPFASSDVLFRKAEDKHTICPLCWPLLIN